MCNFFSFITEPGTGNNSGKRFYFDWNYRKNDLENENKINDSYHHDSHSSICRYYKLNEDICNKYEFNPLTKIFEIDKINSDVDDRIQAENWVRNLDFKKIIEPLIIKDIKNPLTNLSENRKFIDDNVIMLLKNWSSSQNTVQRYIDFHLTEQVGSSIKDLVYDYLRCYLSVSLWNSISIHIGHKDYMWDYLLNSVVAYSGSFFNVKYNIGVVSLNKLWDMGLVPSLGGGIWRLHTGKNADVVFKIKESDLLHFRIRNITE